MAAIPLKISDNGNGILVQGTDNVFFPDNATLTFPYNSIILIVDESDMVTFRSAANNDVLFSGQIGKIQIGEGIPTKANIIEKFDEIANQATGGGEEVDYSHLFYGVSYDSQTKKINFYDKNDDLAAQLDATAFIKDGMVDSVAISNGNLVITFNTDAGKEPISIPLTDIFNPANYYDKTAADAKFATQTVVNQEIAARIQADTDINTALGAKADKSDTYTKAEYNPKEVAIANALTQLNDNKADKTQLSSKQDTLVSGTNIKTINNQSLLGSGDITIQGGGMTMQEYYEDVDTNMYRDYTYIETEIGGYPNNFMLVPFDYETGTIVTGGQVIEEYNNELIARLIEEVDDGNYTIEVDGGQYIPMSDITVDGSQLLIEFDWEDSEQQTQTASVQVVSNQVVVTKFPDDCYLKFYSNNYIMGSVDLEATFVKQDGTVTKMVKLEQSEYDQLVLGDGPDPNTLYIIVPDSI